MTSFITITIDTETETETETLPVGPLQQIAKILTYRRRRPTK
ncbi:MULTISPECIES: hypothetical protein [unclassified Pseudomonas]|nr:MULTISPECIES: hypothetical protein [unclassified Pseudomonas]